MQRSFRREQLKYVLYLPPDRHQPRPIVDGLNVHSLGSDADSSGASILGLPLAYAYAAWPGKEGNNAPKPARQKP
jgi:hypothetical protein